MPLSSTIIIWFQRKLGGKQAYHTWLWSCNLTSVWLGTKITNEHHLSDGPWLGQIPYPFTMLITKNYKDALEFVSNVQNSAGLLFMAPPGQTDSAEVMPLNQTVITRLKYPKWLHA